MIDPPMQPTLMDDRVLLRPLAIADWEGMYAVASDPAIWTLHPAHDRWQEPVFRAYFEEGLASGGALTILDRATGAIIGSSRYDGRVAGPGEVEIGWTFLARAYWGGDWNRAIKRLMLEHAFTRYDTALFLVGEANLRSRRAMEKIGGTLLDRLHRFDMAGTDTDHLVYAITRESFTSGPLATG